MTTHQTTTLFAGKAEHYRRYRVDYPAPLVEQALAAVGLRDEVVADLGSGTGMLARWILERGNRVFGVEPAEDMRRVAGEVLGRFGERFVNVAGTAEATTLPASSAGLITAGNAFHYFEPARAREEAGRLLAAGGRVLVVWHDHATRPNDFMTAYRRFIESIATPDLWTFHQPDRFTRSLATFFGDAARGEGVGQYAHPHDWDALLGRFLSTSLAPGEEDPRRAEVLARLAEVFAAHSREGTVEFQLTWRYQWARLGPP